MPKTHLKKFYQEQETKLDESSKMLETQKWFNNPLNQFAEITLATQNHLLAQYLHRLQELTPSNSPSPPPAHVSPQRREVFSPSPPNWLLPPPQTAPEDLRVVAKKDEIQADSSTSGDIIDDDLSVRSSDSGGGQHECPECGKTYSTSSNLARHRQTHRSLEDKKARKCPHCEKTYVSMPAYSMHIRTHNQGCKCPFCGKCFSRPWLLQGHIRTHTGEKPFRCHICDKAFADKSNLRAHIQTHSNTKPFVCTRCNKAFALKSYLYKHEESSCMKMVKQPKIQRRKPTETTNENNYQHLLMALSKKFV